MNVNNYFPDEFEPEESFAFVSEEEEGEDYFDSARLRKRFEKMHFDSRSLPKEDKFASGLPDVKSEFEGTEPSIIMTREKVARFESYDSKQTGCQSETFVTIKQTL